MRRISKTTQVLVMLLAGVALIVLILVLARPDDAPGLTAQVFPSPKQDGGFPYPLPEITDKLATAQPRESAYPPPESTPTGPTPFVTPWPTPPSEDWPTPTPLPSWTPRPPRTPVVKPSDILTPSPTRAPLQLTPVSEGTPPDDLSSLYYGAVNTDEHSEWRAIGMDAEGKRWSDLPACDTSIGGMALSDGYLSPDGRYLALQLANPRGGYVEIWIVDRVTVRTVPCPLQAPVTCQGVFAGWLPDGRFLFRPSNIEIENVPPAGVLAVDLQTGRYDPLDLPVQPQWGYCIAGHPSPSPDGDRLAYSVVEIESGEEFVGIWTMRMDGGDKTKIFSAKGMIGSLEWSPDGKQLLFTRQVVSIQSLPAELWIVNADGSDARLLVDGLPDPGSHASRPAWSPDGHHVAYVRYDQSTASDGELIPLALSNAYVVDTLTGAITRLSAFEQREAGYPTWSPDGSLVAFVSTGREGQDTLWSEVWVAKADGSLLFPISDSGTWWNALIWLPPASPTEGRKP